MSFIVFGPGVSDPITLEQAVTRGLLQFSGHSEPVDPASMDEAAIRNRGEGGGYAGGYAAGGGRGGKAEAYASVATQRIQQQREMGPVQLAHQIMSKPVHTLPSSARVAQVQELFNRYRIGLVPILGPNGQIEGIVSRWFLMRQDVPWRELAQRSVTAVARSPVLTAGPDTNIRELARVLLEQKIHGMPIVDTNHQVMGIVTRSDILRALVNYAPLELWL